MALSQETKEKLINARKKGLSIPELSVLFEVSKSTVLRHVLNTEILPENRARWLGRRNASQIISERQQSLAQKRAVELVPHLNDDLLAVVAAAIYWAEGAKKDFSFTNSDPEMVRVFVSILRRVFEIKNKDLKISIRIYEDLNKDECINFWSKIIEIELRENVRIDILKGKKTGKLKFGMCRVRVKKAGLLLKTIFAINKRVTNLISS